MGERQVGIIPGMGAMVTSVFLSAYQLLCEDYIINKYWNCLILMMLQTCGI
jgi:hypothetical protein